MSAQTGTKETNQSAELTAFYDDYLDWVKAGAPVENYLEFQRGMGLCGNLNAFCMAHGYYGTQYIFEMKLQFKHEGKHDTYPFNNSYMSYQEEVVLENMHLNPKRFAWVKEHSSTEVT